MVRGKRNRFSTPHFLLTDAFQKKVNRHVYAQGGRDANQKAIEKKGLINDHSIPGGNLNRRV